MVLFWFRRDLRISDNAALYHALKKHKEVQPFFIFDSTILSKLENTEDARVNFIYNTIKELKSELQKLGSDLKVYYGEPAKIFTHLIHENKITHVYANRDYEPSAIIRDKSILNLLQENKAEFIAKKDHVIFDRDEVIKKDGKPYTIFTPYSKVWKAKLNSFYTRSYPTEKYMDNLKKSTPDDLISLETMNFKNSTIKAPKFNLAKELISNYRLNRDFPALDGTSKISVQLRFGTLSIRKMVQLAIQHNETWLNELIWRDFYQSILYHFPHTVGKSFKSKYDFIPWINNEDHFDKWCKGETGYPIVDAGMRELNETGFMHNRVRMITASFLTKHLLIDWRWGERYFAEKLLDFDLASNVGGWQWAASSGCDAVPYFRVFNPYLQTERFDKNEVYIKKWVPEYQSSQYPEPIVEHKMARQRAIDTYKKSLSNYK
jgi:deoxyribodipyrimidine photo-lyase